METVRDANNDVTTITRALSCEECSKHKEVIGVLPLCSPLLGQTNASGICVQSRSQRCVANSPKTPQELKSGTILDRQLGETTNDIYDRIKVLLQMRGPPQAEWHRILELKQANKETFEMFAERMWVDFREYSGVGDCNRDHEILLQMLHNNDGPHIQNVLALGGNPPHNTIVWKHVELDIKIEQRSKTLKPTQWVAEGDYNIIICDYCHRPGHKIECCFKLHGAPQSKSKFRKVVDKSQRNRSKTVNKRQAEASSPHADLQAALEQLSKQT